MSRIARTLVATALLSGVAATSASASYLLATDCRPEDKHVQVQYRDAELVEVCY